MSKPQNLTEIEQQAEQTFDKFNQATSRQQFIALVLAVLPLALNRSRCSDFVDMVAQAQVFGAKSVDFAFSAVDVSELCRAKIMIDKYSSYSINPIIRGKLLKISQQNLWLRQLHALALDYIRGFQLSELELGNYIRLSFTYYYLFSDNFEQLQRLIHNDMTSRGQVQSDVYGQTMERLFNLCFMPFDEEVVNALPEQLRDEILTFGIDYLIEKRIKPLPLVAKLDVLAVQNDIVGTVKAQCYLLCEQVDKAQTALDNIMQFTNAALLLKTKAWLAFMQNDHQLCAELYRQSAALEEQSPANTSKSKKRGRKSAKKQGFVEGHHGVFYALSLLKLAYEGQSGAFVALQKQCEAGIGDTAVMAVDVYRTYRAIRSFSFYVEHNNNFHFGTDYRTQAYDYNYYMHWCHIVAGLGYVWSKQAISEEVITRLTRFLPQAIDAGDFIAARVIARLLFHDDNQHKVAREFLNNHWSKTIDLFDFIKPKEDWDIALEQLIAMDESVKPSGAIRSDIRLAWFIDMDEFRLKIFPKEQKANKTGWTKGRAVALKRLLEEKDNIGYLTADDKKVIDCIRLAYEDGHSYRYYSKESYELGGSKALQALIGNPHVFMSNNPLHAIEIVEIEPEVVMTESKNHFKLRMLGMPEEFYDEDDLYSFEMQTLDRYSLTCFSNEQIRVANIIGYDGIEAPKEAKEKVLQGIRSLAKVTNVQAQIDGIEGVDTGLEVIEADTSLYINIYPHQGGLMMECQVMPAGTGGAVMVPGHGHSMLTTSIADKRVRVDRDLAAEQQQFELLQQKVPSFTYVADHQLFLDDLEVALHTLEQLQYLAEEPNEPTVVLQWPKSKPIKLTETLGSKSVSLSVKTDNDWFGLEGEIQVDEDKVLDLKQLLQLVANAQGRFVPLDDGKYLTLTRKLRNQLDVLASAASDGTFHPLASAVVEQAVDGMAISADKPWLEQVKKIKQSFDIELPVPATLQANLRGYQVEGYEWAARLAHWGGGACLADDMGLGKTLQALAVILQRASSGPSLVLAPMSVCFNWQQEVQKFAPTLKVKMLSSGPKKDRAKMVEQLGPFDLLVCSYGLLQNEGEILTQVQWRTMVADEAQAIKNPDAQRTKVAMALKADFAMVTTGTPIENNLAELWSIFRFINAGLLGSRQQFNHRFAKPMENAKQDPEAAKAASEALRRLINPFILRRLKSEVLKELPSRTEINLHVELSQEEWHFYEALRRKAMDTMLASDEKPGQKRIKILAEIMRLRRACCHPKLVMEETDVSSAKLKVFDNLVDELRQGDHKALVFSQFVGHLHILREHLKEKGVSFQYLDGSTTAAARKRAVNAFQAGEGELFLISLKAGGAGLNLTAADYVIHMDPWWNPAVEDQASDRAHRMGQTRPVTIYRLIGQHTIEDKIVALHQQKRDLANSLLEGTDSAGTVSFEDLMGLLKDDV